MLPFQFVYHPDYDFQFGSHVFQSVKYGLIRQQLLADGLAAEQDFVQPEPALDEDLALVHTKEWVRRLRAGLLTLEEERRLEIPYNQQVVHAFWLHAGGSILAARLALEDGIAYNIGGGFHHAYSGHGEGFCAINDIAVAIRRTQISGSIQSAMIVDCDVHHGNGTAAIFENDPAVTTFSIHQQNNYPEDKPPSTIDVNLEDGVGDEEYLYRLGTALIPALEEKHPDLLFYVAGADPYREDRLGGLNLTMEGLMRRDRLVLDAAVQHDIPVAIVLAGGYSQAVRDTVAIHCNTARAARDAVAFHSTTGLVK